MEKSSSSFVSWQGAELCVTSKAITRITKARNTFQANLFTYTTCTKISMEAYCQLNNQTLAVQRSANKIPLRKFLSHMNF